MRVADRSASRNYLKYLNTAKNNMAKTNMQVASGNRFEKISEDVSAGTRVMRTRMDLYQSQKHLDNVKSVNDELAMAEDTMMSIQDILTEAHRLVVKGSSEDKGENGQKPIANEIKALKEQVLYLANAKAGKRFMFGGSNAGLTAPFEVSKDGKLTYNGIDVNEIQRDDDGYFHMDGGERKEIPMDEDVYMDVGLGLRMQGDQIDSSTGMRISFSGLDVLGFGTDPATGFSNNLYSILDDIEKNLRTFNQETLGKLDTQLTNRTAVFTGNVTDIGAKTNFLDTMQTRLESNVDNYKVRIDNLMGVDDKEAATNLAMDDYILKAVLQMGGRILPSSLMDFLR